MKNKNFVEIEQISVLKSIQIYLGGNIVVKRLFKSAVSAVCVLALTLSLSISSSAAPVKKAKLASAAATGTSSITIKWSKVKGVKGYIVYRKSKNKAYAKIATVSKSKASYKDTKLASGTKYFYKLKTYKKSGSKMIYSAFSNVKSATTKFGLKMSPTTVKFTKYNEEKKIYIKGLADNVYREIKWELSDDSLCWMYASKYHNYATVTAKQSGSCTLTAKYNSKVYTCKLVFALPASKCTLVKPKLPAELKYGYNSSYSGLTVYSEMTVTALSYKFKDNYDGTVNLEITYSGQKTGDKDGNNGTSACGLLVKLYNSSDAVVKSSTDFISDLTVGEKFANETISIYNLTTDNYTLVLADYIS